MSVSQSPANLFNRISGVGPDISALTQLSAKKPEFGFDEVMAQQKERKNNERDTVKTSDKVERSVPEPKAKEPVNATAKQDAPEPDNTPSAPVESKGVTAQEPVSDKLDEDVVEAKEPESKEGEPESDGSEDETLAATDGEVVEGEYSDTAADLASELETQDPLAESVVAIGGAGEPKIPGESELAAVPKDYSEASEAVVDPVLEGVISSDKPGTNSEAFASAEVAASQASVVRSSVNNERPLETLSPSPAAVLEPTPVMTAPAAAVVAAPLAADPQTGFTTTSRRFGPASTSPSLSDQAPGKVVEGGGATSYGELKASVSSDGASDNKAQADPKAAQMPFKAAAGFTLEAAALTSSDPARQTAALKEGASSSSSTALEGPRIVASTMSQFQTGSARGAQVQVSVQTAVGQQPQWGSAVAEKVLWMAAQNLTSAEIHLDPPELGPMMVKITVSQDQASVSFASQQIAVREALDQTAFRLREQFDEQGMNLVNVDVSDQGFNQEAGEEDGNAQGGSQANAGDGAEEEHILPMGPEVGIVDYFV